jgi:hypothetical protein
MRKITAQGHIAVTSDETEIQLAAGDGKMIMDIHLKGKKMPVQIMRRAMAYRKFLLLLDMPVYVFVDGRKVLKLYGQKYWVYRPFLVFGWFIRNLFS